MQSSPFRTLLLAGVLGLAAAACTYVTQQAPAPYRPPGVTAPVASTDMGRLLFDRDCAWCHGPQGEGTAFGPDLNGELDGGAYTDFMLRSGRMPLSDPQADAIRGTPRYPDAQIRAIVAYVGTLGGSGPDVPAPNPSLGDLPRGAELYLENCAACHSTTAFGGALTSGQVVPSLHDSTPRDVAEAMLVGPGCSNSSRTCGFGDGAMPRFDLSRDEVNSIARYVVYLQHPDDEGGASIGRVGPVAEGAVAIVVGLGLLLFAIRWIGTRSGEER
jgi:ubiquinol-cytochrome c reductase cytochrome c subunit